MKSIEFFPLKENFREIELRGSTLNSYMNPSPYEFKDMDNKVECMNIGDRYHSIYQATALLGFKRGLRCAERHVRELDRLGPFVREKEYRWFMDGVLQIVDTAKERFQDQTIRIGEEGYEENLKKYKCEYVEEKRQTIIDYSGFRINFSGTSDMDCDNIQYEGSTYGHIIDIKSAGSKWSQEKADAERQKYYYTFLKCVNEGLDGCKFEYHIITKQKTMQFQVFEYYISYEEAYRITKTDLKYYITNEYVRKSGE